MAARRLPVLAQYRDDAVTRLLCAGAHLDEGFAREVDAELTEDRLRATGLSLGIDLVALARHARASVRRTDLRDRRLAGLCAAGVWAAVPAALYGLVVGLPALALAAAAAFVLAWTAAWGLVRGAEDAARRAALGVEHGAQRPKDLAPGVGAEVEDRLLEQRRANVVPYTASAERTNPFVGSGSKIKEMVWQPIDVSRPADDPAGGGKLTIKPFDAVDLHSFIAREMEHIAGLKGLRARNRLYVIGDHVSYVGPDLLPDRLRRPRAQIPKQLVQAGVVQPGAGMRTYLSLERAGEGGRVIVSMHLRARLQHPSLTWEVAAYGIPPLQSRFYRVHQLPQDGWERWWSLFTFATATTGSALVGAPGRLSRRASARRARARGLEKWRREIDRRHLRFDYGAVDSLRERVADWEQLGFSERTDSQDFLQRLQQGVLIATERFLKDHNVDTSSYDQAQQVINTHTYTFQGDIHSSNIGAHGTVNQAGQAQALGKPAGQP
ncbi:hypothetical protein [Streptomyces avidinii]|uniref:Aromatic ring-opening dioxygenase LigA n=1 Tax=Streptomyces avidinii TaxID=1895 RepID=A0ABS4L179_STRAV|nr:hypothetical protein [Streptomyces avidinii]MBP2036043.1 hypothetical protein [Streptomyces avidinii]GGY97817.1 hypothetical protein GCM10010343_24060 [Streptomyces avidinii]